MKTKNLLLSLLFGGTITVGFAQEAAPAATSTEETAKEEEKPKVVVSGYIDTYYLYAFNNPQSGNLMGVGQNGAMPFYAGRAFDRLNNQFSLGLVQTKFAYSDKHSDLVIDLTFGPNAELGNFGNQRMSPSGQGYTTGYFPGNPNQNALYGTSAAIKQAYFTWKATSKFSLTVGQFGTHIGYEVIDAPVNYHYSLSNLFNNGPFYHIGAKANYAFSDKAALMLGVVNNWDALTDWKSQKSFIGQFYFKPVDGWNVYINAITGRNDDGFKSTGNTAYTSANGNTGYSRTLFDLTTGYQVTSKFYLGLNAAYGWYSFKDDANHADIVNAYHSLKPSWGGVAGYVNYAISDVVGIGARYEYFNDNNGVRYIGTTNSSLTITAPITVADGHLIIKPELRIDNAKAVNVNGVNVNYYEDKNGNPTSGQQTFGVAFIYKY